MSNFNSVTLRSHGVRRCHWLRWLLWCAWSGKTSIMRFRHVLAVYTANIWLHHQRCRTLVSYRFTIYLMFTGFLFYYNYICLVDFSDLLLGSPARCVVERRQLSFASALSYSSFFLQF